MLEDRGARSRGIEESNGGRGNDSGRDMVLRKDRRSPLIGLIVDGPSDAKAYEVILRKYGVRCMCRPTRGSFNIRKANSYARELAGKGCERIFYLKDTNCESLTELKEKYREKIKRLRDEVVLKPIKCKLESLLLADAEALKEVTGVEKEYENPEEISKPDKELDRIFRSADYKQGYHKLADAPRIAEQIRRDVLEEKCENFRRFIEQLGIC